MKTRALILIFATIAFAVMPAIIPPFKGYDPGMFPVLIDRPAIQPSGYAFSVWLLIYLWLIAHAGFGLWRRAQDSAWDQARLPLALSVMIGTVWLFIAAAQPLVATVAIWAMLALALRAYLGTPEQADKWLLAAPIALYAGWLTAASAVSLGIMLAGYGILSNDRAALAMLALVLLIALAVQRRKPAMPVYALVLIWALIGVAIANWGDMAMVSYAAILGALVLMGSLIVNRAARSRKAAH